MEKQILKLFLTNNKLKFSEIEKSLKIRSNKLNYHLKKLLKQGILEKNKEHYFLSETSEYLIPYLSEKKSVLPVILVHIGNNKKAFLYKRGKRPYKDYFSLPGGRMIIGEDIPKSAKRIMKEKFNLNIKFNKIKSISLEHIKKNNKILYSFILILVSASPKDKITYTNLEKNKKNIIKSDYFLMKKNTDLDIKIPQIFSKE
jgi:ADP-ribose pyrophosphatase YjhB (NUDIX family)